MKKLLILGTSNATKEIITYAKEIGVYTIVTDDKSPDVSYAKKWADEYWMINTTETEKLVTKCNQEGITGVFCGLSEFNIEMMIKLTNRLGLPCYLSEASWHYSKDKQDFKQKCKEYNVPVAKDYYISTEYKQDELEAVEFPVVVKPIDQNGNRGISYCYNKQELLASCKLARSVSKSEKLVVEKLLKGKEWYSYYAMANGDIRLIALNAMYAQPGEEKNLYSLTTTVSDNVKRFINEINPQIEYLLKGLECREGIAWVQEMLDDDNQFYVIEMGYRLPGDMTFIQYERMLSFNTIKWLVDYSLGKKNQFGELPKSQIEAFEKCGCSYNLWVSEAGILKCIDGIDDVTANYSITFHSGTIEGDSLVKHEHVGTFAFVAENIEEMCSIISYINQKVKVILDDGKDVMIRYTDFDNLRTIYKNGLEEK